MIASALVEIPFLPCLPVEVLRHSNHPLRIKINSIYHLALCSIYQNDIYQSRKVNLDPLGAHDCDTLKLAGNSNDPEVKCK